MKIRKIRKLLLYASVALTTASCMVNSTDYDVNKTSQTKTVKFSLSVPGGAMPKPSSRTLSEGEEKQIANIDVLAFHTTGEYAGKLAKKEKGTLISGNTFEVKLPEGVYDLVVFGNASSIIDATSGLIPQTVGKAEAVNSLIVSNPDGYWESETIPMWGYADNVTINETTSLTGENAIDMTRMTAKIDVQVIAAAAGTNNENFELTSVRLYNYNTVGRLAPDVDNNWNPTGGVVNEGKGIATAPTLPTERGAVTGVDNPLVFEQKHGLTANNLFNTIYTFEADNGSETTLSTNPCLVIGGKYQGGAETFYRVDFVQKSGETYTYLDLLRNHRYVISINSVTGKGHPDPGEAFNSRSVNINVNILEWEEGGINDIVFDGQNYLGVSQSAFEFTRDSYDEGSMDNELRIRTDVPAGWSAKVWADSEGQVSVPTDDTTEEPWLRIDPVSGSGEDTPTNKMILKVDENNSGADRIAYIHIRAGRLIYKVKVTQVFTSRLMLMLRNPVTQVEVQEYTWIPKSTTPEDLRFDLIWGPKSSNVLTNHIKWKSESSGMIVFHVESGYDGIAEEDGTIPGGQLGAGKKSYKIRPVWVDPDEFPNTSSEIEFTVDDGFGGILRKTLRLRYFRYHLLTDIAPEYLLEGQTEKINVKANFPWKITAVDDSDEILQNPGALVGVIGGDNTTTGDALSFTMSPPTYYGSKHGKTATIKVTSLIDNSIWNITVTAEEPIYVGMFAGELKADINGVWQFEKPLYVQRKNELLGGIDRIKWANASSLTEATSYTDGKNNTAKLNELSPTDYPAANKCFQKNAGWYLPAQKQLLAIWAVHGSFEASSLFNSSIYWSSTQYSNTNEGSSWYIAFNNGSSAGGNKVSPYHVRCVREGN